jgi:OOP family OmpA-OmpF porin
MKITTLTLAFFTALSASGAALASEFDGGFAGLRMGAIRSNLDGPISTAAGTGGVDASTLGVDGGYNWQVQKYLLGIDAFADSNSSSNNVSSHTYGADLKAGLPHNNWLPYIRLGVAHQNASLNTTSYNGSGFHGGLGLEYKFAPHWGANAEWLTNYAISGGSKMTNDTFGLGVRYYFATPPQPAPVAKPAPEPAPVAVAQPEPAPAPAVEPAPAPVVVETPPPPKPAPAPHKIIKLEGVNFATDSAVLTKEADAKLKVVLAAAKEFPTDKLEIAGHTDSTGSKAHNQKLSEHRAASVKEWLTKHGIAADRMSTVGYGDTKPVASNKTKKGRADNRRVEVRYTAQD